MFELVNQPRQRLRKIGHKRKLSAISYQLSAAATPVELSVDRCLNSLISRASGSAKSGIKESCQLSAGWVELSVDRCFAFVKSAAPAAPQNPKKLSDVSHQRLRRRVGLKADS
jgi:hypothetical protein